MNRLKHILLVEDSKNDVELIVAALHEGHIANPVTVLQDGVQALAYLQTADPASIPIVVLLDIKMPKMNGMEVLRALKADDRLKQLPVVMLTSSREGPDIDECYRLGVNAYVVKPVAFDEFFRAIKDVGRFWAVVNHPPKAEPVAEPAQVAMKQ
ncbi:MAG TPA: response regulator [Verrucomicrobiae bacterium]|jgi:CheY-like chemotaxis protein|nr:response regulator [Verrucomicrobiae bacterium]